ncbi:MAG: glycosyltransferase [Acidobacteriota bacterium]|nr:glycosyltransferase [Acidobacteriota bacterium]
MTEHPSLLVTVIITCYNQARFIGETIESVIGQTHPDCEVIVVDDGSTDDTAQIVARYEGVRYIRQTNQGVAAARNTGLRHSKGEYLIIMDGDDRLLPDTVAIGLEKHEEHPECAFVAGCISFIATDGSPIRSPTSVPANDSRDEGEFYTTLLRDNFIMMPAMVMYRRTAFDAVGGFNSFADHSCDYDIYLRMARQFPVFQHDKVVAEYRLHEANTSHRFAVMLKSAMTVYRAQWKYVKGNKQLEGIYKYGARTWRNRYGENLLEKLRDDVLKGGRGEWKQILRDSLILLRYSPQVFAARAKRKLLKSTFGLKRLLKSDR